MILLIFFHVLVSYDVNKDGVKVAVLTFTKSAYRLGETVVGVVELNERASRARVLKACILFSSCCHFSLSLISTNTVLYSSQRR